MSPQAYYATLNIQAVAKLYPTVKLEAQFPYGFRVVANGKALCGWQQTPNKAWRAAAKRLGIQARKPKATP